MPVFDFQCKTCSYSFEKALPFGQINIPICPKCKSKLVQKLLSPPTVVFKGSGFYKTDSRKITEKSLTELKKPEKKVETKKSEEKKKS